MYMYLQFCWTDDVHSLVECNGHVNQLEPHLFTGHALDARTFADDILRHADSRPKAHGSRPVVNAYLYTCQQQTQLHYY